MDTDPHTSRQPILFAPPPDDPRLLATSNRSGWLRPLLWNSRRDVCHDLPLGGLEGDVVPLDWSSDGREILLRQWLRAEQQLYVYEVNPGRLRRLDHPSGSVGFSVSFFTDAGAYFAPSGEIFALWSDVASAPRLIGLDHNSGRQTRVVLDAGAAPTGRPWRSVTFPSSDGQLVQGWFGTPGGEGPRPAIVQVHGGRNVVTAAVGVLVLVEVLSFTTVEAAVARGVSVRPTKRVTRQRPPSPHRCAPCWHWTVGRSQPRNSSSPHQPRWSRSRPAPAWCLLSA